MTPADRPIVALDGLDPGATWSVLIDLSNELGITRIAAARRVLEDLARA